MSLSISFFFPPLLKVINNILLAVIMETLE